MAETTTGVVTRRRPACPRCREATEVYRLRDGLNRLIRTRPKVYGCDGCCSTFAHRTTRNGGQRRG